MKCEGCKQQKKADNCRRCYLEEIKKHEKSKDKYYDNLDYIYDLLSSITSLSPAFISTLDKISAFILLERLENLSGE